MAKTMSIIRYKYKADRDYESVQFEGMSCSLGELKRLIVEKSSRSGTHHSRDDYDLIISNATTHEEYKDNSDMIPRNTSVVVARRIRGTLESLTPSSNQKPVVSSDDIVNEYLRPAILQPTILATTNSPSSSIVESKAIPLEMLTQSSNNTSTPELSEDEKIKQVVKTSQSRYLPAHRSNTSYTCHNCKQPGHIRNQCPHLLQSSSTNSTGNGNGSSSSSGVDHSSKNAGTQSTGSGSTTQSISHSSHIITNQSPYQLSYHHNNHHHHHHHHHGNRSHHRGQGYPRNEPIPKKPTGIPRDGLIQIPRHISGALKDQTGASVVPWQMAQLFVEKSEKKADALAQRARQFQEKGVLPPAPPPSMLPTKSADEEPPPDDLLCPICKQVYTDAVIIPCCHNSFCDECIRTALVESEDHECPHCHRQHVAIDQINPNLFLRKYVNRWREERQNKSSYSYGSISQQTSTINYSSSQTLEQDLDLTPTRTSGSTNNQNLNDIDEYDAAILSTIPQQSVVPPVKTAPIVIKMQSIGQSSSPSQPIVLTKPADMTFEDEKAPDTDQTTSSQKDVTSELSATNNNTNKETSNTITDINVSENEKFDRQTPPSQVAPVSTILSSPPTTTTTTMSASSSVVPHYYPAPPHILTHQQHVPHGIIYPHQILPTSSNGLHPIQPNFYSPPMHVPYLGAPHPMGGPPILPMNVLGGGLHPYSGHPPYPPTHPHHPIVPPHLQPNRLNGFHVAHYETANVPSLHHPNTTYATTSTSTLIAHHHQTAAQSIPTSVSSSSSSSLAPALSKDEFYMKQRYLQRIQRSSSRRRSRSRSSSYSSYASSDSRSSSFSRRDDRRRPRRRSSRSRSHQRHVVRRREDNRAISPNRRQEHRSTRSNSKQRRLPVEHRSPSYRDRRRPPPSSSSSNDNYSSKYRRPSPRPYRSTREREKRRSPRPPPTIQQSTQRTIVYMHESSFSKQNSGRDRHRTRSRSRNRSRVNDDRTAPSSKFEQQSQSESILSSSPMTVPSDQPRPPTLSSTITSVIEENSSNNNQTNDVTEDKTSNSEKKRKKHHHHKKHRHHHSKSPSSKIKRHRHSKDDDTKTIVSNSTTNSTSVIEAQ